MIVSELIEKLKELPQDAKIGVFSSSFYDCSFLGEAKDIVYPAGWLPDGSRTVAIVQDKDDM